MQTLQLDTCRIRCVHLSQRQFASSSQFFQAVDSLLSLVRNQLDAVEQEATSLEQAATSRDDTSSAGNEGLSIRMARLQQLVTEGQWRAQLLNHVRQGDGDTGRSKSSFMTRMLASPTTLLCWCLLAKDHDSANDVLNMFHIDDSRSQETRFAKQFCDLSAAMTSDKDDTRASVHNSMANVLQSLSPLATVQVYLDLAVASSKTQADSARFPLLANDTLERCLRETNYPPRRTWPAFDRSSNRVLTSFEEC